jgi:hypothetical protein
MATWQVQFHIYPSGSETKPWGWPPERLNKLSTVVAEILPRNENWSNAQMLWGEADSHCFEVWLTKSGEPEEARLRLDARRQDILTVAHRCFDVLTSFNLTIADAESGEVLWAKTQLPETIRRSRASAFVSDPERWLIDQDSDPR